VLVLRERLGRAQWVAVALAAAGVAVVTLRHGRLPWIALALAVSFGLYGLARKTVGADGHLVVLGWRGSGAFGSSEAGLCALLALAGPVTAALLALFVFREPFTPAHAAAFACIWTALAILTWDLRKRLRRAGVERRGGRAA
jgi:chloramphenicol-sensitive protein RarD